MGRPPKKDDQKADTVPVTLRFPRELHERLTALAARDERTFLITVMRMIRAGFDATDGEHGNGGKKGAR
jgi:hypothetical protein